jgi:regulatory factor X, other
MQSIEQPTKSVAGAPQGGAMRSRSNTSSSSHNQRPKSRGSTTSVQSVGLGVGFQPHAEQMSGDQSTAYIQHGGPPGGFSQNPEDVLLQHYHMTQQQMGSHAAVSHHDMRPHSQHGFQEMQYPVSYATSGIPHYPMHSVGIPQQHIHHHMRQHSEHYLGEGSPAPDDSNTEAGGAKRRKGTASSLANDQELRRLLDQYEGKTLKDVAAEVQRNEGAGGKSEKAKQVFAMIW